MSMPSECMVIALLICILSFSFFRAKRKNWGFAVLPLVVIPLSVGIIMYTVTTILKQSYTFILPMIVVIVSLIGSCIWIGISSVILVKSKKLRFTYLFASIGFSAVLSIIILLRYYGELCV